MDDELRECQTRIDAQGDDLTELHAELVALRAEVARLREEARTLRLALEEGER